MIRIGGEQGGGASRTLITGYHGPWSFSGAIPDEVPRIHVKVNSYGPGRPLCLVYFDPVSGKKIAKSARTRDWREAERLAGELEKELRAGRYAAPSQIVMGRLPQAVRG